MKRGFAPPGMLESVLNSRWCKYDLYQGMPSGVPEVLPYECAFRRWGGALGSHNC
jgi:hypothetical protein